MPPFPGLPEAPGPDHSFIVNKNIIMAIALLAIALMPTGQWFGVDSLLSRPCRRCCGKGSAPTTQDAADASLKPNV